MNRDIDAERRLADWLEDGPTEPSSWAVDEAIVQAVRHAQRLAPRTSWRDPMHPSFRLMAAAIATAAVIVFAVTRLPAATGPGAASPPPAVTSPSPSVPPLSGEYVATVPANSVGTMPGEWHISFLGGQIFLRNPGGPSFAQPVTFTAANRFTVGAEDADNACPSGTGDGIYDWSLAGSTLTLTKVTDASACRSEVLTSGPWVSVAP